MTLKSAIQIFLLLALLAPCLACEQSEQNRGAEVEEGGDDPDSEPDGDDDPDPEPDEEEPAQSTFPSSAIELLLLD